MNLTSRARQLRRDSTDAERLLWGTVRDRQLAGYKFRRQTPIGRYIVDFVCRERRLIIELDGGQHQRQVDYDQKRTEFLESLGYRVLRIWNHNALTDLESVADAILLQLRKEGPSP